MRIRLASHEDLDDMIGVFMESAAFMVERYTPEQAADFPGDDPSRFVPLWRHLLETGAMWIAEDPGPVGIASAYLRDGWWFLALLFVRPEAHGRGIGSALLDEALAWGHGAAAFTVVASPSPGAQALYLRRSMFPVWVQQQWEGPAGEAERPAGVEPLLPSDAGWVAALDREARGIARPEDHAFWRAHGEGLALRREGRPLGYVYVSAAGRIGPAAAWEAGDQVALLRAARSRVRGEVVLQVPSSNRVLLAEVVRAGLRLTGSTTFMASGPMPDGSRYVPAGGALA